MNNPRRCEICTAVRDVRPVGKQGWQSIRLCADCRKDDRELEEKLGGGWDKDDKTAGPD